jgi:signal transduction histidine kinase
VIDERQMARLKDELVSTVSHELHTPLTSISGTLSLLAAGELAPRVQHLIGLGQKNAERLVNLVNDLLDMDKLQSGKLHFHFEENDLGDLLAQAVEQNRPFAEGYGVTLHLEVLEAGIRAAVDAARLFQVQTNLLSNACKFSPSGSTVQVCLTKEGETARISVADAGPGIPAEFRPRLFSRSSQEDGAHQKRPYGHRAGAGDQQSDRRIASRHPPARS